MDSSRAYRLSIFDVSRMIFELPSLLDALEGFLLFFFIYYFFACLIAADILFLFLFSA